MTRDSDRSGEAGETRSGSTVGESAGRNGIAQPSGDKLRTELEPLLARLREPRSAKSFGWKHAALLNPDGPEAAEAITALLLRIDGLTEARAKTCRVPPKGWWCSREAGHEGPCAARPVNPVQELCDKLYRRFDDEPDFLGMEAATWMEVAGEALQRIHRYALAAEGAGYDLILSVTDPLVSQ